MYYLVKNGSVTQVDFDPTKTPPAGSFLVEGGAGQAVVGDLFSVGGGFRKPFTVDEKRASVLADLLTVRENHMYAPIVSDGHSFYGDKDSQNLINQTLSSSDRGIEVFPANWILEDGTVMSVIYDDLKAVNALVVTRTAANFANYYVLVQEVMASETPDTIDLTIGWV